MRNIICSNIQKSFKEFDIFKSKAAVGEIREWKSGKFQKQANGSWIPIAEQKKLNNNLDDFLYDLKSDFIVNYDDFDEQVFINFYNNNSKKIREEGFFLGYIADLANNISKDTLFKISKTKSRVVSNSFYEEESNGYWVAAYNDNFDEIHINSEYLSENMEWEMSENYKRIMLHETGHKLFRDDLIDTNHLIDLWKTKERVTSQARIDMEENLVETFAIYLMTVGLEKNIENNFQLKELKDDYPKSFDIIKKVIVEL